MIKSQFGAQYIFNWRALDVVPWMRLEVLDGQTVHWQTCSVFRRSSVEASATLSTVSSSPHIGAKQQCGLVRRKPVWLEWRTHRARPSTPNRVVSGRKCVWYYCWQLLTKDSFGAPTRTFLPPLSLPLSPLSGTSCASRNVLLRY
jgi:hypothetical protein